MDDARPLARRRRPPPLKESTLKADPFAQLALLDLQQLDSTLAQLTHRRRTLPELAALADLAAQRSEVDGQRVEHETRVSDLTSAQRKADGEVEQVRARRTRDQQRLDSGQVTSPKDLESIQHEVVALDRRIATLEDAELEVMEELDQAEHALAGVRVELSDLDEQISRVRAARDDALAGIGAREDETSAGRGEVAEKIPTDLMALYDKVRAQQGGFAAAALRQRRCEGCRLELNGADLRELSGRPSDEVLRCPECDRILVRTGESGP